MLVTPSYLLKREQEASILRVDENGTYYYERSNQYLKTSLATTQYVQGAFAYAKNSKKIAYLLAYSLALPTLELQND